MPNFGVFPLSSFLLSGQTATTNGTSGVLSLGTDSAAGSMKLGSSYRVTVELLTASSTVTNFNLGLFASDDNGTVYHGILGFSALTTSGQGRSALIRPYLGIGDAATVVTSPILGSTDYASNVDVVANGPFDPRFLKARWVAVTTGTVTFNLKVCMIPQDMSD